jgi:hypothetical protein
LNHRLPLPRAPGFTRSHDEAGVLHRSLLLAVLLHLWAALMLGNTPGPDRPGRGGWGQLTVTLQGESGSGKDTTPVWRDEGPLGNGRTSRQGGRLREQPAPADAGPGAQQIGRWRAQAVPTEPSRTETDSAGTPGQVPVAPEAAPATRPFEAPPAAVLSLPRDAAPRPRTAAAQDLPAALLPPPTPTALRPAPAQLELPPALRRLTAETPSAPGVTAPRAAGIEPLPANATPTPLAPTVPEQIALPPSVLALPNPAEPATRPSRTPALEALPAPRSADLRAVVPSQIDLPPALRRLTPDSSAPPRPSPGAAPERLALPPAARSELSRMTPERIDLPPSLRTLAPEAGVRSTADRSERLERVAPSPSTAPDNALRAAPSEAPATTEPQAPPAPVTPQAGPAEPIQTGKRSTAPTALPRGDPLADPATRGAAGATQASPGAPDAGTRVGHDVATPPAAAASAPLAPLNLALPRPGGSLAGPLRRGPGLLELLPAPPERKTKLQQGVEAARREDCMTAHGDKGLLAVVPLVVDTLRDKGCKW